MSLSAEGADFEWGVRELAEALIRVALDDEHHGELNCEDVRKVAHGFGVVIDVDAIK